MKTAWEYDLLQNTLLNVVRDASQVAPCDIAGHVDPARCSFAFDFERLKLVTARSINVVPIRRLSMTGEPMRAPISSWMQMEQAFFTPANQERVVAHPEREHAMNKTQTRAEIFGCDEGAVLRSMPRAPEEPSFDPPYSIDRFDPIPRLIERYCV